MAEILRRSAENTMHALVRTVFSKLHSLDAQSEEEKLLAAEEDVFDGELKMTVSTAESLTFEGSPEIIGDGESELVDDVAPHSTSPVASRPECTFQHLHYLLVLL
jgi:brefeldin A-resistance guanine nucleotide exchange factor 1